MATSRTPQHIRCWQQVAEEIAIEKDPEKLGDLADELNRLLAGYQERQKPLPRKISRV